MLGGIWGWRSGWGAVVIEQNKVLEPEQKEEGVYTERLAWGIRDGLA